MNADVYQSFTRVNPLARVWQPRGLNWVLSQHDVQWAQPAERPAHHQPQPPFHAQPQAQPGRLQQHAQEQRAQAPKQPQARPEPAQPSELPQTPSAARPDQLRPLPTRLPVMWAQRLNATRPGLIVWTYAALGQDLLGVQSEDLDKRRAFLGQLLRDLNHPGGTHTFWPVTLPATADADAPFVPDADAFWAGMAKLRARAVVALGDDAVQALGLPAPLGFMQQTIYRGALVLPVWDVAELLQGEASSRKYRSMLDYVRRFLSPIIARAYPD